MTVSVTMPALGESVTEGTVTRWLKQEGDSVQADEPLLEISTDKVDTEVPSPGSGQLLEILVDEGETVLASVRKTSKVIVLHEDTITGGFGAEITAAIAEEAFEDLDAPPKRVAAPDTPVPFAPVLEEAFLPQVSDVVAALREVGGY